VDDELAADGAEPGAPDARRPGDEQAALLALATAGWRQAILVVAVRLDLAAMFGARSADLEEVCYSLGTPRQATRLFLAACEGLGLVEEDADEYRLGPLGHALRAPAGPVLADWTTTSAEPRVRGALWDALRGAEPGAARPAPTASPGLAAVRALGLPYGAAPPADVARARAVLDALHGAAAVALATALPPPAGLVVESGGEGVYARALLARDERAQAILVDATLGPAGADDRPPGAAARVRTVAALEALGDERAAAAVLAPTTRTLSLGALRTQLGRLRDYVAGGAPVVVVGPFRGGGPGRPLAPLLALLELAAGGPGWCPTAEQVADPVRASGLVVMHTLRLPEPDLAIVAQRA